MYALYYYFVYCPTLSTKVRVGNFICFLHCWDFLADISSREYMPWIKRDLGDMNQLFLHSVQFQCEYFTELNVILIFKSTPHSFHTI